MSDDAPRVVDAQTGKTTANLAVVLVISLERRIWRVRVRKRAKGEVEAGRIMYICSLLQRFPYATSE